MDDSLHIDEQWRIKLTSTIIVLLVALGYLFRVTMDEQPTPYEPFAVIGLIYGIIATMCFRGYYGFWHIVLNTMGIVGISLVWYQSVVLFEACFERDTGHYLLVCGKEFTVIALEAIPLGLFTAGAAIWTYVSTHRLLEMNLMALAKKKKKQQ